MSMNIIFMDAGMDFPPVERADPSGILAVGGDLSTERLLKAYSSGIFPWFSEGDPLIWWSPDPRYILEPGEVHIPASLKRVLNKGTFRITYDTAFAEVMERCSLPRKGQSGTWITSDMKEAYCRLHAEGWAHSVEAWKDETLAGGLYGVSLGSVFFGESMFTTVPDASKAAFATLCHRLHELEFGFIDCQVQTDHLRRFGAHPVPRKEFIMLLKKALEQPTIKGSWNPAPGYI
jgi:leucyl/phenylalanyl-tRNA---protein transferase